MVMNSATSMRRSPDSIFAILLLCISIASGNEVVLRAVKSLRTVSSDNRQMNAQNHQIRRRARRL
jgi:hypothetical protein